MPRKKKSTPEPPRRHIDGRTIINIDALNLSRTLSATEEFLAAHGKYEDFTAQAGTGSPIIAVDLVGNTQATAYQLVDELEAAGL